MSSVKKVANTEDLNDSWVDLYNSSQNSNVQPQTSQLPTVDQLSHCSIEKLLIEAQKESRSPSRPCSKESSTRGRRIGIDHADLDTSEAESEPVPIVTIPKSPNSPNSEWAQEFRSRQVDPGTDWIWDWSSRPEVIPPGDWNGKFKHPGAKARGPRLSMRNTRVMKNGVFSLENLPTLLMTHACTFFLGAAVMFICVKKYCGWMTVNSD